MPAATTRCAGRWWFPAILAVALAAAGCAGNSLGAGYGYNSPPPAGFLLSGPPAIVAVASLEEDSLRAPMALRAAAVLREQQWPIVVADSATGVLIGDWQYFEPTVPTRPASALCERGIGLRLKVLPDRKAGRVRLSEEIAYSPQVDQQQARSYARLVFRALYDAIKAAPDPSGEVPDESGGWIELTKNLSRGDFHVCGSASS